MAGPFSGAVTREQVLARIAAHPIEGSAAEKRAAFALLATGQRDAGEPRDIVLAGRGGTIVYLHGGGYAFGSPRTHERIGRGLADRTGLAVAMPHYPLAPEERWPAQLEAALAAVRAAEPPVVLAGDSAGGHLALVAALELGDAVAGVIAFSPNTDRSGLSRTRAANAASDPMVDDDGDRALARQALGDTPPDHPHASPLLADLSRLPPLHLEVGAGEVLLGDSLLLADAARAAGRAVTVHVEPDGLHMMQLWAPHFPAANRSLDRAALFARHVTA